MSFVLRCRHTPLRRKPFILREARKTLSNSRDLRHLRKRFTGVSRFCMKTTFLYYNLSFLFLQSCSSAFDHKKTFIRDKKREGFVSSGDTPPPGIGTRSWTVFLALQNRVFLCVILHGSYTITPSIFARFSSQISIVFCECSHSCLRNSRSENRAMP